MGIWKDKKRKDWRYEFQYRGERYAGGGHGTRREAEIARVQRRQAVKELPQTKTDMAFSVYANEYLDHSKRKYVKDTYLRKVRACSAFIKSQGDLDITEITALNIHSFLKSLQTNNAHNEYREELSAAFTWIKKTYAAQLPYLINPCSATEKMPTIEKEKKIPTEEELLRIIAAAKAGDEQDIIMCCIHLLGRIDEILRLRWLVDVNFEKREITLWTRKRKDGAYQSNVMPMGESLYQVLLSRWHKRQQDKWVFYNNSTGNRYFARPKLMASVCSRAGIKPIGKGKMKIWRGKDIGKIVEIDHYFGFHSLRHFAASYLFDHDKISLKTVSGLLRHKNVRTTEIYLHSLDPSHRAAITGFDEKFTTPANNPQASPTSIKEKGVT